MPVVSRQGHQFPELHIQSEETGDLQSDSHSALHPNGNHILKLTVLYEKRHRSEVVYCLVILQISNVWCQWCAAELQLSVVTNLVVSGVLENVQHNIITQQTTLPNMSPPDVAHQNKVNIKLQHLEIQLCTFLLKSSAHELYNYTDLKKNHQQFHSLVKLMHTLNKKRSEKRDNFDVYNLLCFKILNGK